MAKNKKANKKSKQPGPDVDLMRDLPDDQLGDLERTLSDSDQ